MGWDGDAGSAVAVSWIGREIEGTQRNTFSDLSSSSFIEVSHSNMITPLHHLREKANQPYPLECLPHLRSLTPFVLLTRFSNAYCITLYRLGDWCIGGFATECIGSAWHALAPPLYTLIYIRNSVLSLSHSRHRLGTGDSIYALDHYMSCGERQQTLDLSIGRGGRARLSSLSSLSWSIRTYCFSLVWLMS